MVEDWGAGGLGKRYGGLEEDHSCEREKWWDCGYILKVGPL